MSTHQRLGDVLLQRELITREQLDEALARHYVGRRRLGEVLLSMGVINQEQLSWALSESLHIPFVELSDDVIDLEVARSLPEAVLRRHEAVPVLRVNDEMTVLLADPTNRQAAIELEALSGAKVTVALAAREAVIHFLDRAFPDSRQVAGQPNGAPSGQNGQNGHTGHNGNGVLDLTGVSQVFALLLGAARDQATELHLEPAPNGVLVRVRVDGRLVDRAWFDRELLAPITFRLRLLAGMKGEAGPRLARIRTRLDGRDTELEFFFFPTLSGEAVTVRFQPVSTETPTLEALDAPESVRRLLVELAGVAPALRPGRARRGGGSRRAGPRRGSLRARRRRGDGRAPGPHRGAAGLVRGARLPPGRASQRLRDGGCAGARPGGGRAPRRGRDPAGARRRGPGQRRARRAGPGGPRPLLGTKCASPISRPSTSGVRCSR